MAKVLVTGANGHVGANTVRRLLARGHEVTPVVREGSDLRGLEGLGLSYRYADILDAEAIRLADETGIETIRLCPAVVLGPWDYRITPSMGPMALDLINGNGVTYKGGINIVHAYDVGEVHARAVDQGKPGGRYIVGSENVDMVQVGELVEKWTGIKPRYLGASRGAAMALGGVLDFASKFTGKEPQFSRSAAHEHAHRYGYFDCAETNRVFDLTPKSADEAMYDAIRWLLFTGKIKRNLPDSVVERLSPDAEWNSG